MDNKCSNNDDEEVVMNPIKKMKVAQSLLEDIEDMALKDVAFHAHVTSNLRVIKGWLLGLKAKLDVGTLHSLSQPPFDARLEDRNIHCHKNFLTYTPHRDGNLK